MQQSSGLQPGGPRSAGAIPQRRIPQAWPKDRRFRILSIDGGGIRGIFPAALLAGLEGNITGGHSIADYFDLVAGTSTGGIIALGLGAGLSAAALRDLYVRRGGEIFPPTGTNRAGRLTAWFRKKRQYFRYAYDQDALRRVLTDTLGDRLLEVSRLRLCIPAFDGRHSEAFVFKTPHHSDYRFDRYEQMVNIGLATAAAPTYFKPLEHGGYILVDGGIWANNPVMLAVIEALTCFDVTWDQIDVLSLGCGNDPFYVTEAQRTRGGLIQWRNAIEAAMRLQSLAATNQARLLLGPPAVLRIDAPSFTPRLELDDWKRSVELLIPAAEHALAEKAAEIQKRFLLTMTEPFIPV
jgi:patatin-like phospholipase/acyl hydrolase